MFQQMEGFRGFTGDCSTVRNLLSYNKQVEEVLLRLKQPHGELGRVVTRIFQIFDRYKALAARKRGDEPVANIITANVFQEDGVARKVSPKRAEQSRAQLEALRDYERSSSVDTNDVVVKPLTSTEEIQRESVQKPSATSVSSHTRQTPLLSFYPPNGSQSPQASPVPLGDVKEPSLQSESLVSGWPSKASVDEPNLRKDWLELPLRDTRAILKVKDKTRASSDNGKESPAPFVDATDMLRGLMQLKEDTHSSSDAEEGHRRQLSTVKRDGLRFPSSGAQREGERYELAMPRKEGLRQHTSGEESEGHKYQSCSDRDSWRYPVNEGQRHQAYADQKDDYMHYLHANGGSRNQPSGYVKELTNYQSSGDETNSQTYLSPPEREGQSNAKKGQRYQSSGKERDGHRFHTSSERRGASRHSPFVDREARGTYASSDRSQPPVFKKRDNRSESSGEEWDSHSRQFSAERRDGRRYQSAKVKEGHRPLSSGDEIGGGRRYYSSVERHQIPRHQSSAAGKEGQRYQSSGDGKDGHRHQSAVDPKEGDRYHKSVKEGHRRYLPAHNEGHRQQWYQYSGDERGGHRYGSYEKPHRYESSSRVNDWHRYQSSGDERRGQRSYLSAGNREGGHRHYSSAEARDGRRNQSIEDEREGLRQLSADVQESGRRRSSAKECRRQPSLKVGDDNRQRLLAEAEVGDRGQSTGDEMEGHRYHAFAEEDNRCSCVSNLREGRRNNSDIGLARGHRLESYADANEGRDSESLLALEDHRRNFSSDAWGGSRGQSMKPKKEGRRHQQSLDWRPSQSREKDRLSGLRKDLPPRSSGRKSSVSPRNPMDIRDLARLTVPMREGSQRSVSKEKQGRESHNLSVAKDNRQTPVESGSATARTYQNFRDTLRAIDYRDSQYNLKKGRDGSPRNSVDARDLPRTSSVSRLSVDSRQYQSSTPRLSVDGRPDALRASSLHSSRASLSLEPQFQTNFMDSSGSGDGKRRGPSVVARLMGLTEFPMPDTRSPMSDRPPTRESKLLQKLLNSTSPLSPATDQARKHLHLSEVAQQMKQVSARLQQESHAKPKSKRKSRSSASRPRSPQPPQFQLDAHTQFQEQQQQGFGKVVESGSLQLPPKLPMSPKHHQMEGMPNVIKKRAEGVSPSDVDQRLHQLRIKNSIQEHKTLKQILDAMHLKGLLHPPRNKKLNVLKTPSLKVESAREEAQPPLIGTNQLLASMGNIRRSRRLDLEFQDVLGLQDSVKDTRVQEEPAIAADINGEASIVVMKPLSNQSVTPPASITHPFSRESGDVEERPNGLPSGSGNLTGSAPTTSITMSSNELDNSSYRGRSLSHQVMMSGKASTSGSQEPPVESTLQEVSPDQFTSANVIHSWRACIAAEHSNHVEEGNGRLDPKVPAIIPPFVNCRARDLSLSKSGSTSRSTIQNETEQEVLSPRAQEKLELATLIGGKDSKSAPPALQHETCSKSRVRDGVDFDISKAVGRGQSDRHLAAPSAEAVILPDIASGRASSDRVPAEVAILRLKRPTGKASRPKVKIRWSPSAGVRIEDPASMTQEPGREGGTSCHDPSMDSNQELQTATDTYSSCTVSETPLETITSMRVNSTDNPRNMLGNMQLEVSAEVTEEEQDSPSVATDEAHVQSSEDEAIYSNGSDSPDADGTTPSSPAGSVLGAQQEADVEDVVEEAIEGYTPRVISLEKPQYVQEESGELIEGTSHPSPVSVLDSPSFNEGFHLEELTPSPDSEKTGAISNGAVKGSSDDHEATDAEPPTTSGSEVTKEMPDSLKYIYTKVARSLELNDKELYIGKPGLEFQLPFITDVDDTLKNTLESTLENQEVKTYVGDVLFDSRLMNEPSSLAGDLAEIIQFDVFTRKEEELQTEELNRINRGELDKNEERRYKESIDRRLIFDCVNEILEGKMRPFLNPQPWAPPLLRKQSSGPLLVEEVWDSLQDLHWPVTDAYDALYVLLQKDFTRKEFQWLEFSLEIEEVGVEIEHLIFAELVDEAAQNVMSLNRVQKKKQPTQPQEAATPAPIEDPECRRKDLLERTRRDLLAWHVQYQQL